MIGPFFYYQGQLVAHAIPEEDGEQRAGKLDNPYSHEQLFDEIGSGEDYINIPRGRVVFDMKQASGIIYVDRCIENVPGAIEQLAQIFRLHHFEVQYDDHYVCPGCCDFSSLWR